MSIGTSYGPIWVCTSCMLHHHSGECGGCHDENGHDAEPWGILGAEDGYFALPGLASDEHNGECLMYVLADLRERFPDVEWPDVPDDFGCGCEERTFSTSQCEGCGSYSHGAREAFTLYKQTES